MIRTVLAKVIITLGVSSILFIYGNSRATAESKSSVVISQKATSIGTDLQNATYQIPELGQVKLTNGLFQSGDKPEIVVRMSKQFALGTINPPDENDAATVLWVTHKGTKPSFYLAVFLNQNGQLKNVDTIPLTHGFLVKSIAINKQQITVKMLKYGLNDPPCCPSKETSETYSFNAISGNLIPTSLGLQLPNPDGVQVKDISAPMPIRINNLGSPFPENEIEIQF